MNLADLLTSASTANLLSGLVGVLVGATIGAVVPFFVQRREWIQRNAEMAREWQRRDEERERERLERAESGKAAEVQRRVAAIRALAIEAFTNAIGFLTFAEEVRTISRRAPAPSVSRHQFEQVVSFQSQWLESGHFQTVVVTYMQALVFEQQLGVPAPIPPPLPETIERARALSMAFEIIFRTLAQSKDGFSPSAVESLERALNVLKIRE
jgi:hypothetical protein